MKFYCLVYQVGIANVFRIVDNKPTRLLQSDFRACETFTRGLIEAGARVWVRSCDKAGDIAGLYPWTAGKGEHFTENKHMVPARYDDTMPVCPNGVSTWSISCEPCTLGHGADCCDWHGTGAKWVSDISRAGE